VCWFPRSGSPVSRMTMSCGAGVVTAKISIESIAQTALKTVRLSQLCVPILYFNYNCHRTLNHFHARMYGISSLSKQRHKYRGSPTDIAILLQPSRQQKGDYKPSGNGGRSRSLRRRVPYALASHPESQLQRSLPLAQQRQHTCPHCHDTKIPCKTMTLCKIIYVHATSLLGL
jgi:hypothetical protein